MYDRRGACRPAALMPPCCCARPEVCLPPLEVEVDFVRRLHAAFERNRARARSDRGPHRRHPRCRPALGAGRGPFTNGARAACQRFPDPPPGRPCPTISHPSTGDAESRSREAPAQRAGTRWPLERGSVAPPPPPRPVFPSRLKPSGGLDWGLSFYQRLACSLAVAPQLRSGGPAADHESAAPPLWPALPRPACLRLRGPGPLPQCSTALSRRLPPTPQGSSAPSPLCSLVRPRCALSPALLCVA